MQASKRVSNLFIAVLVLVLLPSLVWGQASSGLVQPRLIHRVEPQYPLEMVAAGPNLGRVSLQIVVGLDGIPKNLTVVSYTKQGFVEAAKAAVKQWRYKPGSHYGRPIELPALTEVRFQRPEPTAPDDTVALTKSGKPTIRKQESPEAYDHATVKRDSEPLIVPPKLIHVLEPEYPAGVSGVEGVVLVRITVNDNGVPQEPVVVRSLGPQFDEAAVKAVRHWRYQPARLSGKPTELAALAEVQFHVPTASSRASIRSAGHGETTIARKSGTNTAAGIPERTTKPAPQSANEGSGDTEFFGHPIEGLPENTRFALHLRSENFSLASDWKEPGSLGQILLDLEHARALFLSLYGKVPPGATAVEVYQNTSDLRSECSSSFALGCYKPDGLGGGKILLSKQVIAGSHMERSGAVHEYTHLVQNLMGYSHAPSWVVEGVAGYFERIEFKDGAIHVGYTHPDWAKAALQTWVPVDRLVSLSTHDLGEARVSSFYFLSYLLIHVLRHSPDYSSKLPEFLKLVKEGTVRSADAFLDVYGVTCSELDSQLRNYFQRGKFQQFAAYPGIKYPNEIRVADASGRKVKVKKKKCYSCTARKVGEVLRHVPIFIPVP